ncbi:hypothetical protein [Halorussus halophilus]|uniref:hypothetical protein n=1 Tax=Halorussus halophilus TaxID=2650975 RepID=UPI0013013C5B|nr:hypothetical protein [Halorussus halophilus]
MSDSSDPSDPPEDSGNTARVREYVLDAHPDTVQCILDCADAVADDWEESTDSAAFTTSRDAVVSPLRDHLESAGAWSRFPELLAGAVDAAGDSLSATPVAAPPYVTVTSRGPLLRATISTGRLVVSFPVFDVRRGSSTDCVAGDSTRYVRGARTPKDAICVELK